MTSEEVKKALNFFNDCQRNNKGDFLIDFYIMTPGGNIDAYFVLRDYMEKAEFSINLIATDYIASAGFMLFYNTDNVFKTIIPHTAALIHLISISLEDRDLRNKDSIAPVEKSIVDDMNSEVLEELKLNKNLSRPNYQKIKEGNDVLLKYVDFYQLMLKCPYGTLVKAGEEITL